ncbi:MAG: PilZ domain-containing protein [Pseudomonadota bacterium]
MSALPQPKFVDSRRYQRVDVSVLGRFMLSNRQEFPCQTKNMSPGGVALVSPVRPEPNERVVCYLDHIGRLEGNVARIFDGGFAMHINGTTRKRERLAAQLTWLANRHALNLPEDRRHDRDSSKQSMTHITLVDGREYKCRVLDISLSGAAIAIEVKPAIGSPITLGQMRGRVVRHFDEGIAVEFSVVFKDTDAVTERLFSL